MLEIFVTLTCINQIPIYSEHKCWFQRGSVMTGITVYLINDVKAEEQFYRELYKQIPNWFPTCTYVLCWSAEAQFYIELYKNIPIRFWSPTCTYVLCWCL